VSVERPVGIKQHGLDIEVRSRDDSHFSRRGRRWIEVFIGREEVSKAIVKWFEDEGRAKELGIVKSCPAGKDIRGHF
jgi:hypothetical protein